MTTKFVVQHIGHPLAGCPIQSDEWKIYSTHKTESAAWKAVKRANAHLEYGQWDDHYRVIAPDGHICDPSEFWAKSEATRHIKRHASGTAPDTSLHLGNERRAWLQSQGGIQPTINRLIDQAM